MPNAQNIEAPVSLVAPGRSGTSLITDIFNRHPEFQSVGETVNLIFSGWSTAEFARRVTIPRFDESWLSDEETASQLVRQAFQLCFPGEQPRWFHKPIGVPMELSSRFDVHQWDEAAEWYWKVMGHVFPRGKFFTILRHPCDVVLSSQSYWGYDEAAIWWSLGLQSYLIAHRTSPIEYAVLFDDLVGNSEAVVRSLFTYLDVPFYSEVMKAFSTAHAPAKDRKNSSRMITSRKSEWDKLTPWKAQTRDIDAIVNCFTKFGYNLQMPEAFTLNSSRGAPEQAESAVSQETEQEKIERLQQSIARMNKHIEHLHLDYTGKVQRVLKQNHDNWLERGKWIAKLEKDKLRLIEQRQKWQQIAEEHQQLHHRQQAQVAQLERSVALMERQRNYWISETERLAALLSAGRVLNSSYSPEPAADRDAFAGVAGDPS